jgi:16S rRNA (uracil1498-N3)-methyltransferase
MEPRFHAPLARTPGSTIDLPANEARHLARVLRLRAGARIAVFDGHGLEFLAEVVDVTRRGVRVILLEPREPVPEPRVRLTLIQAVLKGEHMDAVVRDAVMLGVAAIQPVTTARSQVPAAVLRRGAGLARWERIAVSSAKQCRRAVVPPVAPARSLEEVIDTSPPAGTARVLLVEPAAAIASVREPADLGKGGPPDAAELAIGPEGGWTSGEIDRAIAGGFEPITLGRRTLRADAVPVAAVAVLQFIWGDL